MIYNHNIKPVYVIQLIALLFVLFSSRTGVSQKFSLGVKGTGSLTWAAFGDREARDVFGRKLKPGYGAAFIIGFPLRDRYDLLLEAGGASRGRILTFNDDPMWRNNLTIRTADVAMMLRRSVKFRLKKDTPAEGFINLGPEISYWINSNGFLQVTEGPKYRYDFIFDGEIEPSSGGNYRIYAQDMNRWLFSLGIGVGLKAPITKTKYVTTELRFSSGHTFLGKSNSVDQNSIAGLIWGEGNMQDTMKTNLKTVSLSVAYTVDVDKKEKRKGKSTIKKKIRR
jgi:hypothetical protein